MRTRFTWVLGILALIAIGFLIACSTKYSSSANGLVIVPTQGSAVMQTFSLNLNTGGITQINNAAGPPTPGLPTGVVLDPAGKFAYVIVMQNSQLPGSSTGIAVFPVGSDGKLAAASATTPFNPLGSVPVVPAALAIDSAGKFLFVANSVTNGVPGTVSVFAVSNGSLTEVANSPFPVPLGAEGPANLTALAVSPTAFPPLFAACSQKAAPTSENLYVTDSENNMVWEFGVSSSGTLVSPPGDQSILGFPTGTLPSGIAIDPCNRFAYIADQSPDNRISAYTVCNTVALPSCTIADGSLVEVSGSPFANQGIDPGPMTEDPFGNHLYVVNTSSSTISGYKISSVTGALTAMTPATVATNSKPVSIAVRSDGNWLFVANFNSANVSQYAITPASGRLTPQTGFATDNFPFGVAVK
ncbi:MAG: beta-propeller fold lactonase family protein [Candidatus Sulfotelmatobacter sp.]